MGIETHPQAREELKRIGVDPRAWEILAQKALHLVVKVEKVSLPAANILKQEMLGLGGDAALARGVITGEAKSSDLLLLGNLRQLDKLSEKLSHQPFGLDGLAQDLKGTIEQYKEEKEYLLDCRGRVLDLSRRPHIMGVLNVTPDSFSDGDRYLDPQLALRRAEQLIEEGADIIDIGGESTRPGADPVSLSEELGRVLPVVEGLSSPEGVIISVDTYKSQVAQRAIDAGAHLINDPSGLRFDSQIAQVIARAGAGLVIMHIKGKPKDMQINPQYDDLMGEIYSWLDQGAQLALQAGVARERIVVDPGLGFGKRLQDNLVILRRLDELKGLGYPILIGPSRKSFIGEVLGLPVEDRLEGTAAAVALGVAKGAKILRVHDVKGLGRVARMAYAIAEADGAF